MAVNQRMQFDAVNQNVIAVTAASLNPGAVAATTTATGTVTVTGAAVGDYVEVSCQTALGNVTISGEVTAVNTVTVKFANCTAAPITPAGGAALYNVVVYQRNPVLFV